MKWRISGARIQAFDQLGFPDSYRSNLQLALCKRIPCRLLQSMSVKVCLSTIISCYLRKIIKIGFPELEKKISSTISLFIRKMIA